MWALRVNEEGLPPSLLAVCTKGLSENNYVHGKLLVLWQTVGNHLDGLCEKSELSGFHVWHRWCIGLHVFES